MTKAMQLDALLHFHVAMVDVRCSFELAVVFARTPFTSAVGVRAPKSDGPTLPIHDAGEAFSPLYALKHKTERKQRKQRKQIRQRKQRKQSGHALYHEFCVIHTPSQFVCTDIPIYNYIFCIPIYCIFMYAYMYVYMYVCVLLITTLIGELILMPPQHDHAGHLQSATYINP